MYLITAGTYKYGHHGATKYMAPWASDNDSFGDISFDDQANMYLIIVGTYKYGNPGATKYMASWASHNDNSYTTAITRSTRMTAHACTHPSPHPSTTAHTPAPKPTWAVRPTPQNPKT